MRLCLLLHLPPARAEQISRVVWYVLCVLLMAAAAALTVCCAVGIWPCAAAGVLILRLLSCTREEICV